MTKRVPTTDCKRPVMGTRTVPVTYQIYLELVMVRGRTHIYARTCVAKDWCPNSALKNAAIQPEMMTCWVVHPLVALFSMWCSEISHIVSCTHHIQWTWDGGTPCAIEFWNCRCCSWIYSCAENQATERCKPVHLALLNSGWIYWNFHRVARRWLCLKLESKENIQRE
jgi:hypothetical protein